MKPVVEGGAVAAACSSSVSDGAAAMLFASEQGGAGTRPASARCIVAASPYAARKPIRMLSAPIPATAYALKKTGMSLEAIDLVEIDERLRRGRPPPGLETGADPEKVSMVNGGAIALRGIRRGRRA